ncbi:hypothetical protein [Salibacterium salarium]|uniref:hypothetical protein n=1 Tax=Salibacterium salarium TaxID=284579 RepID=UPI00163B349B|nr:hypothetical protein [Salibacterium salarium]
MKQKHFAEELQKDFEKKLGRLLTADERALIQWIAERQAKDGDAQSEVLEAES